MTSRSRRKHRTTVQSTPARNRNTPACRSDVAGNRFLFSRPPRVSLGAGLVIGLAIAAWSAPGAAADSHPRLSAAGAVSSNSQKVGHKLKWLPYRPSVRAATGPAAVRDAEIQTAARTPVPAAPQSRGGAFEDPFDDTAATRRMPPLAAVPGGSAPVGSLAGAEPGSDSLGDGPPAEPAPEDPRRDYPVGRLPGEQPGGNIAQQLRPPLDFSPEQDQVELTEDCPSPYDAGYYTKIGELSSDISAEAGQLPRECAVTEETISPFAAGEVRRNAIGQPFASTNFTWKASALCHKPLYFEDVHLERYGHSWGPRLQPVISGAKFFLTIPILPYKMGLYPPCECIYSLGYYRPGSCAPYMLDPLPLSIRAALAEGAACTGAAFLIP